MRLTDIASYATIFAALVAILQLVQYVWGIAKWFKGRLKRKEGAIEHREMQFKKAAFSEWAIVILHVLALLGIAFLWLLVLEKMTTVPQLGIDRPLPLWAGYLLMTPLSAFATRWVFLSMMDMSFFFHPEGLKRPYTPQARGYFGVLCFVLGALVPWALYFCE